MTTPHPHPIQPGESASPLAFADAVSSHRPYLIRFASRRLRDAALAEDVVQETLLAALQGAAGFDRKAALRTWLTGILLRRIADSVRRQSRHPLAGGVADESAEDDDHGAADETARARAEAIDWIDPQRRLEGRQFLEALAACLGALSPAAVQVFTLREIDGLSNEEAASQLGLSTRSSAVLLHRARASVRAGLAPHGPSGRHALAA